MECKLNRALWITVSILVLVDYGFLQVEVEIEEGVYKVSILVLVDYGFLPVLTFNLAFPTYLVYYTIKSLMVCSPIFIQNHVFFDVFRNFSGSVYILNARF